jgi:glycopeptide antibiotics resistance protein
MNMLSGLDIVFANWPILWNIYMHSLFIIYIICRRQYICVKLFKYTQSIKNQPESGRFFTSEWLNTIEQRYLRLGDHVYSNKIDCQR